jgi:hypothetical protein
LKTNDSSSNPALALSSRFAPSAFTEHMTAWQVQHEQKEFTDLLAASPYGKYLRDETARLARER